jgi:hypothetical protein
VGDEFGIYYRPEVAAGRVGAARMTLFFRIGSLVFSGVVIGVLWAVWPETFGSLAPWFLAASLISGGGMAVASLIAWLRAGADAKIAVPGLAIGLNRAGVLIGQHWLTWPEVGSLVIKPGSLGASTALVATGRDNFSVRVPLDVTDAMPASLDSVVRVLSGGRTWVDLSRLD